MAAWDAWNPAAGFFHSATRDVDFVDYIEGARLLDKKARTYPAPSPIKRYPGATTHPLPQASGEGEFPQVLLQRRTWRQFDRRAVTLADLGTLLGLTSGVQHWATVKGQGSSP